MHGAMFQVTPYEIASNTVVFPVKSTQIHPRNCWSRSRVFPWNAAGKQDRNVIDEEIDPEDFLHVNED